MSVWGQCGLMPSTWPHPGTSPGALRLPELHVCAVLDFVARIRRKPHPGILLNKRCQRVGNLKCGGFIGFWRVDKLADDCYFQFLRFFTR